MQISVKFPVFFLMVVAIAFSVDSFAEDWSPDLKFRIEGGDLEENMTWISGFAYARDSLYRRHDCLGSDGQVGSKDLVKVLNDKFKGEDITAEKATAALDGYLFRRYEKGCF